MKSRKAKRQADEKRLTDSIYDDISFRWRVRKSGHQWIKTKPANPHAGREYYLLLTDNSAPGQVYEWSEYSPLKREWLFQEFAEIPQTEDGIRAFADEWGLLGGKADLDNPSEAALLHPQDSGGAMIKGEMFEFWRGSIREMNRAVRLWKWVRLGQLESLRKFVYWREAGEHNIAGWVFHEEHPERSSKFPNFVPSTGSFLDPEEYPELTRDCLAAASLRFVQRWVNKHLEIRCSPRVLWHVDRKEYVVRMMPHDLLGAFWWQFARAFTGETKPRLCRMCGRLMQIGRGRFGFNESRVFCSAACRQKDHRARVNEAKRLRNEGLGLKAIADRLGTETAVIRNWIHKSK